METYISLPICVLQSVYTHLYDVFRTFFSFHYVKHFELPGCWNTNKPDWLVSERHTSLDSNKDAPIWNMQLELVYGF